MFLHTIVTSNPYSKSIRVGLLQAGLHFATHGKMFIHLSDFVATALRRH
jgi:hypothetical protein